MTAVAAGAAVFLQAAAAAAAAAHFQLAPFHKVLVQLWCFVSGITIC
jgi:hypothetical protein